jgi:hypothetical protein
VKPNYCVHLDYLPVHDVSGEEVAGICRNCDAQIEPHGVHLPLHVQLSRGLITEFTDTVVTQRGGLMRRHGWVDDQLQMHVEYEDFYEGIEVYVS